MWDDHEVEDNWSGELPGNATPPSQRRVGFAERKRAGMLAFFEWMPRYRMPAGSSQIYGSVPLGANAELFLLDTRQYRDNQPCNDSFLVPPCTEGETRPVRPRTTRGARAPAGDRDEGRHVHHR